MAYPPVFTFDVTLFRATFPFFANTTAYPDATLQRFWTMGTNYISNENFGTLRDASRLLGLQLMTAHLAALNDLIILEAGAPSTMVKSATIDKISVSLEMPPGKTQFQWWLNLTTWGQQLLALLSAKSVGGWSVGGSPVTSAFRGVAGFRRCW